MKVILVNVISVKEDKRHAFVYLATSQSGCSAETLAVTPEMNIEKVELRTFVNEDGNAVKIGWTKELQEALGLPFELFERQNERLQANEDHFNEVILRYNTRLAELVFEQELAYKQLKSAHKQIVAFANMTFWQRLKFLITDRRPT